MTDLKEMIEQELDQYLEWPTADKSHVTTVSAKLFAEHVARLYADHFRDAGKMVGEPTPDMISAGVAFALGTQLSSSYRWPDYVRDLYGCMQGLAPAVQGEPVAYLFPDEVGRTKIVLGKETAEHWCPPDESITPLYTAPQPAEQQPVPDAAELQAELERERKRRFDGNEQASREHREDVAELVEALEWLRGAINATPENDKVQAGTWISTKHPRIKQIDAILAARRKQEPSHDNQ